MTCKFLHGTGKEKREFVWCGVDGKVERTASVTELLALGMVDFDVTCAGVEMVMRPFVFFPSPGMVSTVDRALGVLPMHQFYPDDSFQRRSHMS